MTTPANDVLDQALEEAIEIVKRASGRSFIPEGSATTKTFDGIENVGRRIIVPIQDCDTPDSVVIGTTELVEDTDYRLLPKNRKAGEPVEALEFLTSTPRGKDVLEIESVYGWPETPKVIHRAVIRLAAALIPRSYADPSAGGAVAERKIGDRQIKYVEGSNGFIPRDSAEREAMKIAVAMRRVPYV
ncbi:MAG TPA: hypothetical protein VK171_01520 [Fimbriimonas sp.]|nr:hypothetical protein [Fimbriimonas sp.]